MSKAFIQIETDVLVVGGGLAFAAWFTRLASFAFRAFTRLTWLTRFTWLARLTGFALFTRLTFGAFRTLGALLAFGARGARFAFWTRGVGVALGAFAAVVVAAAGNFGMNPATGLAGYAGVTSPGNAPSVITVGSQQLNGTPSIAPT